LRFQNRATKGAVMKNSEPKQLLHFVFGGELQSSDELAF
jgi:hypothetical protein